MRRKFLFSILLFAIFSAVCIYALVRAQGTQISPDGNIVSTSIIRVNSTPTDVNVYINDKLATKNENRVEWLQPGETKVTLKKAGYRDWEKIVDLKAGIIEDIYAQLYPDSANFIKLTSLNVDNFYFANNSDFIFYSVINGENASENGLWKLKLKRNLLDIGALVPAKVYTYSAEELLKLQKNPYRIKIADDNTKVLLDIPDLKELDYIDLNNPTPVSVTDLLSFYPKESNWMQNTNIVIASNENLLVSLDLNSRDQKLIYYSQDKEIIYGTASNEVFFYRFDKNLLYNVQGNQSNPVVFPAAYKGSQLISRIITTKDNVDIFYTLEGTTLNFIDLDKNISISFDDVTSVLAVSASGRELVYKNSAEEIKTIVLKDSNDLKTYVANSYPIDLKATDLISFSYTQSGKNLVALARNATGGKLIWFMDNDGLNSVQILKDEKLASNSLGIDSNGLALFVLLEDKSETIENSTVNNVYKFDLEAK